MDVRDAACDALLAHRVEAKLKGNKLNQVINRIHVAMPKPRDNVKREAFIPEAVLTRRKYDPEDPFRRRLEKDVEAEEGGAGVYNINMRSMSSRIFVGILLTSFIESWVLSDPSWKEDAIPEILDGKNVADFIDPDIAEKLEALEREEERLEAEGFYASDDSMVSRFWITRLSSHLP
jgi:nucleolar GTP-binding protein